MKMLSVMFYRPEAWSTTRMKRCPHAVRGLIQKKFEVELIKFCKSLEMSFAFLAPRSITETSIKEKVPVLILMYVSTHEGWDMTAEKALKVLSFLAKHKILVNCFGYEETPSLDQVLSSSIETVGLVGDQPGLPKGLN